MLKGAALAHDFEFAFSCFDVPSRQINHESNVVHFLASINLN